MINGENIFKANPNNKLLLISLLMLIAIKPAMDLIINHYGLGQNYYISLIEQVTLIIILCVSAIIIGNIRLSQIGIDAWKNWNTTNKIVFFIVTPIIIIIFSYIFYAGVKLFLNHSELYGIGFVILFRAFLYGCYQELLYRGILQTELVKRWGFWIGTIISNLVFTFGPEHFHFYKSNHIGFAYMFCLGLLFSFIFYRSKNLISVGIWHGIGNIFIDGLRILISII
jgi:membrane protease YdiL (CAAX protease family)